MPDPNSHHPSMLTVIRPSAMPRLWWLNPWAAAKYFHSAATAMKDYADRVDSCLDIQKAIIDDQSAEIARLRRSVTDLHDSIVAGRAIVPDAEPVQEEGGRP